QTTTAATGKHASRSLLATLTIQGSILRGQYEFRADKDKFPATTKASAAQLEALFQTNWPDGKRCGSGV
ncbi:MAG: hypothetical protein OEM00_05195, partial [Burkholderiaceae bacterium]|nr:hypothetical protein [Burkholderiaceae bacterium]